MRKLKFIVDGQIIKQDPECDFGNLIPGSSGYLVADFAFSKEWNGTVRVAAFSNVKKECPPQILKDGHSCIIPEEALKSKVFYINVLGKNKDSKIKTNKVKVVQNGG